MTEAFYNAKNLTISNGFVRNPDRYYLEEYFKQKPAMNIDLEPASADDNNDGATKAEIATMMATNKDFEVLGTNMTSALCTFDADRAGIKLTTATADQDQAILAPHLDTNQTAWTNVKWGTENQIEWECAICLPTITHQKVWGGLKLTNDQLIATDADQLFFKFQTDATNGETFSDFTKLHFIHSIGNTDYISQLPVTIAANTNYKLKIVIDSSRCASIFVNNVQYDITTETLSTGTAVEKGTKQTAILTDDVDFIPYIGIETGTTAAKSLHVYYQKISRILFE